MRVISHTCSNTEIVCALGAADQLIAIDQDSDFPPEVVSVLPTLGRDLDFDVEAVKAMRPDLVLSSLTVPGHEQIVDALQQAGLPVLVIAPNSLQAVFDSVQTIAEALDRQAQGQTLIDDMQRQMPPQPVAHDAPNILVEWWPKPVIGAARQSWVHDLIERAGGRNACADMDSETLILDPQETPPIRVDAVAMSWCGVQVDKYRADIVLQRPGWQQTPAIRQGRVHAISEAYLGRPGPRLVEGYRALRNLVSAGA